MTGRAFPSSVVVPVAPSLSDPASVADALPDVTSPLVALASAVLAVVSAVVLAGLGSSAVDPLVPSLIGYAPLLQELIEVSRAGGEDGDGQKCAADHRCERTMRGSAREAVAPRPGTLTALYFARGVAR
ncbi:hypothetical protein [Nannocystis pusilla]|uniref:hypothetical protein n=1 Tax=Nannocystis pusilla TaxID=889268 RepID=UPI003B774C0F